jgi:NAD(P)-dependent dehydrogenase (short-subunit alcohol dehydrogenase family)
MTGKSVLITGCSSGIGRRAAERLQAAGWRVLLTLRGGPARATMLGIGESPGLRVAALDVTNTEERAAISDLIVRDFEGRIDALVLNAGYALFGALEDLSEEQIRTQTETNLLGHILLTRSLLPALRAARGRIVAVSSVLGATPFPLTSIYCASKFALEGFTRSLRHELQPHGVAVALVRPGRRRTRFGENIVWGAGNVPAYRGQTSAYRHLRNTLAARPAGDADVVAAAIERLLTRRRMPPVLAVGGDARILLAAERLLPTGWSDALLGHLYARAFDPANTR